ncbi:E3 ubiquitin-protein ligase Arkadia-like [Vigna radiata var. radiata]|uniref:RING-type E3 ubiquitin transferase n=1 Tax=Vigna radiata var. radiata TaxID=3916 RepID=A0A3Q0F382_VIGRR|nr:E3 ubiquitin-protein ligase Arkadia-like [Vigna radiata var. radiata]
MNPHVEGGSAGQGNASNQNYCRPHLPSETQEGLLPLFPLFATEEAFPESEVNLPQQGTDNIGATTDVPLQETPNVVAPESNIFSSRPLAGNPLENVDLCLHVGFSRQDPAISSAALPSSNLARSVHGSDSNSVGIPRKRGSGEFHRGESSNMGEGTGEVKRLATESQVRANNNVNPSPQSLSVVQQQHQFLRGRHVNPNNEGTPFLPPNTPDDERRGYHAPIPSQANGASSHSQLFPLQPSHSVRPLSFLSSSFMSSSSAPSVNNLTVRNAPLSISSPCPHARVDNMIPFYEHRNDMFGPVVTSTYRPNGPYVDIDRDTTRRALLYGLRQFEPPEPLQLLPGIMGNGGRVSNAGANTYHPLRDYDSATAWFLPQGSRGTNHSPPPRNSGTQNHHRPIPQFPPLESLRELPSEIEHPVVFGMPQAFTGLSLETIMQLMEREIFLVDGDDSEETKEKCPVCLEEFCRGEDIGKLHSCVHKFHFDCIKEWLMQRNLCPVCRRTALERPNHPNLLYIL